MSRSPALFDAHLVFDWSASSKPKRGRDSIWWAEADRAGRIRYIDNPVTRAEAEAALRKRMSRALAAGERLLVGFDFALAFPAGLAAALGLEGPRWRAIWDLLAAELRDDQLAGSNNRFEVAAALNARLDGAGPFWGCPASRSGPNLGPTLPRSARHGLAIRRRCEQRWPGTKSPWQLFYNGSVGSQALLGIPVLARIRADPNLSPAIRVWPFETGPTISPEVRVVFAEVYPSLLRLAAPPQAIKDRLQVEQLAIHFARADASGALQAALAEPWSLPDAERRIVLEEEGWILHP